MTNDEFKKVAEKFNDSKVPRTVDELIKQLDLLPKETEIVFWYAGMFADLDEENGKQTLFISDP